MIFATPPESPSLSLETRPQALVGGESRGWRPGQPPAAGSQHGHDGLPALAVGFPSQNCSPRHKEGQPGGVTKASVGGKVTAHFSLNAPVWGLHLITRCFKQMAREGRDGSWLLPRGSRRTNPESRPGVPGCPAQPLLQKLLQGWRPEPLLAREASKYPPTHLR